MRKLRTLPLYGPALLLLSLRPGPAAAVDRFEYPGECHPPVLATIDPDWQNEALRFQKSSLHTFARYLDGEAAARRELQQVLGLSEATRAAAFDVIELTKELLIRGFRGKDLEAVRAATLDVSARLGGEKAARFSKVLGGARQRGTFSAADLGDLAEVVGGNLLREALGRRLGLRGEPETVRAQVNERLRADPLDAAPAIEAVLEALLRQLRAARPGDPARSALGECIALMSKTCTKKAATEHCKGTPREYLELLRRDL